MDAMAAVGARIDAIEARLASLSSPTAAPVRATATAAAPAPAGTGATTAAFTAALAAAQGGTATTLPGAPGAGLGSGSSTGSLATALAALRPAALAGAGAVSLPGSTAVSAVTGAPTSSAPAPAALSAAALKSYGNGRIPPAALASIGGGERLWAPAAEAFTRMREAARTQGVTIGVNDSYRSYDEQVDMARRKGLYSQGGLAAQPGTSDHGWGRAVDLQLDAGAQSWMRANGERFGFAEDTPREPWHWGYTG